MSRTGDAVRRWLLGAGAVLIALGVWQFGKIGYFYYRSATEGEELLKQAGDVVAERPSGGELPGSGSPVQPDAGRSKEERDAGKNFDKNVAGNTTTPAVPHAVPLEKTSSTKKATKQQVLGVLEVPDLKVKAPIVEGTGDEQVAVAVGHLSTSVRPGVKGTSVLAGHNATWFRHLDRLRQGDRFLVSMRHGDFWYEVTHSKVVKVGDLIEDTSYSRVVLESCYPLDAWQLTDERYLVFAKLVEGQ